MEPTTQAKGRGRPQGSDYGVVKSIRFTEGDDELLSGLAREWGCSEAAVIRQLLRRAAKVAEMTPGARQETDDA